MEAEFKKQDEAKVIAKKNEVTPEEQAEALEKKITDMIKAKKAEADEAKSADQKKESAEK